MIGALSKAHSLTFQNIDLLRERSLTDSSNHPSSPAFVVCYCPLLPPSIFFYSLPSTVLHCPLLSFTSPPTVRSNAKAIWANAHPMSSEELITKQAEMVYEAKPGVEGEMPRTFSF